MVTARKIRSRNVTPTCYGSHVHLSTNQSATCGFPRSAQASPMLQRRPALSSSFVVRDSVALVSWHHCRTISVCFASSCGKVVLCFCNKMKHLAIFGCLLAGVVIASGDSPKSELKVDSVYVPEGCESKSKNGDMLTMHYTGTLADGTKFDSRYDFLSYIH